MSATMEAHASATHTDLDGPGSLAASRLVRSSGAATICAAVFGALFGVVTLALILVPWQQSAAGQGRVVAYAPLERQQTIEAPIEGRVVKFWVRDGSHVRAAEPLLEISDNDPQIINRLRQERDAVQGRVDAARARESAIGERIVQLNQSRGNAVGAATSRVRMAQDRVRGARQVVQATEALARTTQLNADRQRALIGEGLASTRTGELAELDRVRATTEVDRARAALSAAQSEESALQSDLLRVGTDGFAQIEDARAARAAALSEIASATGELARIEVRLARQATQLVVAPRDGTVLRLIAATGGEQVKAGDPLLVFVPDTDARAVELWVDGNDVPLLADGQHVRLQFEGWPALQFTGWPTLAYGTFGGRIAVIDSADNGQGKFRVLVVPEPGGRWPTGRYLRQGVRANGWVLLNRVRLGWELWRQFNGFPPMPAPLGAPPERTK
ncbi:MAG: HlyD family efflux transporter periplasmic adaptor subunit [Deltaproteobacteria bacterium]|nr:HlyD family efflux transporter periplasmic adaptor subunit [Myxococcales bacterium]MDP3219624.1 HlyD family efflux transporter periplasmic adaptor subunit [Deltaproteobacteria bacterium]